LEAGINKISKDKLESIEENFSTSCKVAKINRPFRDLPIDAEVKALKIWT
jgi:hypothetical protein